MAVQATPREDSQFAPDLPHLVLIERAQRLHDAFLRYQLLDAGHPVVVRLDDRGFFRPAGFDGVRVDGSLAQNPVARPARQRDSITRSSTRTNSSPMMWRFCSGSVTPANAPRNCSSACSIVDRARGQRIRTGGRRIRFPPGASGRYRRRLPARGPGPRAHAVEGVNATRGIHAATHEKEDAAGSPTSSRISCSMTGTRWRGSQSFWQPQTRNTKLDRNSMPRTVCTTSG